MKKKLKQEKQDLIVGRLAQSADGEHLRRRLLQLDFEVQKLEQGEV
jgi:hypothetical protein